MSTSSCDCDRENMLTGVCMSCDDTRVPLEQMIDRYQLCMKQWYIMYDSLSRISESMRVVHQNDPKNDLAEWAQITAGRAISEVRGYE